MKYSIVKSLIANPGERIYHDHTYVVSNELGPIAIAYADSEQDALDEAADAGKLDSQLMSDSDYQEYSENGWDDSYLLAGNASEPFWQEYLGIQEITRTNNRSTTP